MSNINELILNESIFSGNDLRSMGGQSEMSQFDQTRNYNNRLAAPLKTAGNAAWKYVGKPTAYVAGGIAATPVLATMGVNALANSGVGKGLFGGALAGAAAHYGGQYATQGMSNLAQYAADHGINNAVASNLAEWVPMAGNVVSAGTSMATQHLINKINDEKDIARGISPTSSWFGNAIKNVAAAGAGFIGGPIASAIQGLRAGWAQHDLDKIKKQKAYMNAANSNMQQQPNQMDQMNGY